MRASFLPNFFQRAIKLGISRQHFALVKRRVGDDRVRPFLFEFGIIHSAETGPAPPPLTHRKGSFVAAISPASLAERTSIQIMQGRRGLPCWSRATTEQHVVSTVNAMMPAGFRLALAMAPLTDWPMQAYQSSGFCSAQEGMGELGFVRCRYGSQRPAIEIEDKSPDRLGAAVNTDHIAHAVSPSMAVHCASVSS